MRVILILSLSLVAVSSAQFIENSCPAPSDHITGLTDLMGVVVAVDSLDDCLYFFDGWTGQVYDTVPLPWSPCSPVGLTSNNDTLMFAEYGTRDIYAMTADGDPLGVFFIIDAFPITGLSCGNDLNPEYLYIMSWGQTLFQFELPLSTGDVIDSWVYSGCPETHDIAMVYNDCVAIACEDSVSPVRIYWDPENYDPLMIGDFESAVGVGTCTEGNRFWFSDPDMGMIHRYCCDMGGITGEEPEPAVGISMPNPVSISTVAELQIPCDGEFSITVTDMAGRIVTEVFAGSMSAGSTQIPLDMEGFPAGSYLLRVTSGDITATRQFTLLPRTK